jgi:hypothetical protein
MPKMLLAAFSWEEATFSGNSTMGTFLSASQSNHVTKAMVAVVKFDRYNIIEGQNKPRAGPD